MSEQIAHLRANAALLYQHARQSAARVPVKARVVLGLFLAAAVLMAMYTAFTAKDASLHLKLQHAFHNAQVSVWVDSDLAFAGKITGATKKRFGLIPTASVEGNLSQIIPVRSGQHDIRVRIEPDDAVRHKTKSAQTLPVTPSKPSLSPLGGAGCRYLGRVEVLPPAETSSSFAWLWRYASTLFLTGAGSIISALTGFALRELPAHIRARQTSEPKAQSTTAGQ